MLQRGFAPPAPPNRENPAVGGLSHRQNVPDRRMLQGGTRSPPCMKLKLETFIPSESFAINTKTGFLARDTLPSVDFVIECA